MIKQFTQQLVSAFYVSLELAGFAGVLYLLWGQNIVG